MFDLELRKIVYQCRSKVWGKIINGKNFSFPFGSVANKNHFCNNVTWSLQLS